ncbi:TPA: hypothetical protein ACF334_004479 [Vibrio parahaemolyticus]
MLVRQEVIDEMKNRGFELVEGCAILNDRVAVELNIPYRMTKVLHLKTPEAVELFNNECSGAWSGGLGVFRKQSQEIELKP